MSVLQAAAVEVAPWWGVPVVAGGFLLIGGFLTFLFTRANDKRKERKAHADLIARETLDLAAEMMTLGAKFTKLGQRSLVVPLDEFFPIVVPETGPLIDEHMLLLNRLRLVMPSSLEKTLVKYSATTISLVVPPFDDTMRMRLDRQAECQRQFVDELRHLRGLPGLDAQSRLGGQAIKEDFADRAAERMKQQLENQGIRVVDDSGQGQHGS